MAVIWLLPVIYALYTSFRPFSDTADRGYVSIAHHLSMESYKNAWTHADLVLTLLLASLVAFSVSRFSWQFNLVLPMLFTAGNLFPQQVLITPLYRIFLETPPPQSHARLGHYGSILIPVAFQLGFCVFVLSNYIKTCL